MIFVFSISFLVFFVYARQKQNDLVFQQENMREQYEKELILSRVEVQEMTYAALSRDLHDNVGQLLSSAKLLLGAIRRSPGQDPEILGSAENILSQAIGEIRSLSKSLDKEWLRQFSFLENLSLETGRLADHTGLQISLDAPDQISLSPDQQIIAFRIVQEGLQNAIRHSRASAICIEVSQGRNQLAVRVRDNGIGFRADPSREGMGLKNMKYRTGLLGGSIHWEHPASGGTCAVIRIPVTSSKPLS